MSTIKFIGLVLACFASVMSWAQPASFLVKNVRVHVGNTEVLENAFIAVKNGKIHEVSTATPNEKAYAQVYDGQGGDVYPGLIAPNTRLGLNEIDAVRAMQDYREVGLFSPNVRALIAFDTDSEVLPTIRANGILFVEPTPEGGRISGMSSLMHLTGNNWEEATHAADVAVHLRWPARMRYTGWWAQRGSSQANKNYARQLRALHVYFDAAKAYLQRENPTPKNLKFEAMKPLFAKERKVFIHVNTAKSILEALQFATHYGLDIVLVGAQEAWRVTEAIKAANVPIILGNTQSLPRRSDDDVDQPFKTPYQLWKAGIPFAFSMVGSWEQRSLPFQAGQAVGFGLPKEEALKALTLTPATIFGVNTRIGSLEKGKDASFILSKGDLLDMRTSVVTMAFIEGKMVSLDDKQKRLYRKYMKRYGLDKDDALLQDMKAQNAQVEAAEAAQPR